MPEDKIEKVLKLLKNQFQLKHQLEMKDSSLGDFIEDILLLNHHWRMQLKKVSTLQPMMSLLH